MKEKEIEIKNKEKKEKQTGAPIIPRLVRPYSATRGECIAEVMYMIPAHPKKQCDPRPRARRPRTETVRNRPIGNMQVVRTLQFFFSLFIFSFRLFFQWNYVVV
jgi:hypothetical protein